MDGLRKLARPRFVDVKWPVTSLAVQRVDRVRTLLLAVHHYPQPPPRDELWRFRVRAADRDGKQR